MRFKKSFFLLSLIVLVFLSPSAFAAEYGDFVYEEIDGTIMITSYTGAGGAVVIPSAIESKPVVGIGDYAFYGAATLTGISIPDNVTSIGGYAFQNCTGLTGITIPEKVTIIGLGAFYDCANLTSINVDANNDAFSSHDGVLYNKTATTLITCPAGKSGAFIIPGSVTSIRYWAFYDCTALTSVTIPGSVTTIGRYAFYYCTGLTSLTILEGVKTIQDYAFYNCSGLTSLTIPGSVTSIQQFAFRYCTGLTSLAIPGSVTTIGNYAFRDCTGLTSLTILEGVAGIGASAFRGCTSLVSAAIPASVTSIGLSVFLDCTSLTSIDVDEDNPAYRSQGGVLYNNTLTTLVIYPSGKAGEFTVPDSVTTIWDYAFRGCRGLNGVHIPGSVTTIMDEAFRYCTALTGAYFYGNAPVLETRVFDDCAAGFTVYYLAGSSGFTNPWYGYPTAVFTPTTTTTTTIAISGCVDADTDGYGVGDNCTGAADCNDNNPAVNPGAPDDNCDGIDNNCDNSTDEGYISQPTGCGIGACASTGITSCVAGLVLDNCTAGSPADETCNGSDDDCDGETDNNLTFKHYYRDADNDTYGDADNATVACAPPQGYVDNSTGFDCDDSDPLIHTGCDAPVCTLKIIPKTFRQLAALLSPVQIFVISAGRDSGSAFAKPVSIDWETEAINDLVRIRLGRKLVFGFIIVQPFKLKAGDFTVTVTYGAPAETVCGQIAVRTLKDF